ncbi:MAG: carboxylating nicotinate-nucleotide diphosphorylase [Hoeflea sp.]|uniref:carboxylating nicotinate-nucleotide diphosphorylase n=1 Tax=Hoeflea sp. TaxID=1940281 RepID=UPI001D80D7E7|nr:carboxylating nicotinate-nucleotide diphosphorylase [Hoeflea sp.]MBU4528373.1 carboxylating nicotinate-nucleotide diphosphorylase [Alphaproteobacteria bacterium]MBU4543042.1 carboxylating nicotinate-nucleotide diphosphorylase [Alphaproteobacteria bacterium]MBU4551733.1 carboxylating nicotinate-nucleotide diphosphorylase [Alphaproteobacteria bacterium]MBV1723628.1 carboxylating nicotinate-nucleotide diphosphorylase [Hoeflea sp.]MBV1761944.1 carboxylating nicotinate-nucleotide diphosphorylase
MTNAFLPELPALMIEDQVRAALIEDLGRAGDITSNATIGADRLAKAEMNSREAGIIAGLPLAEAAFRLINPTVRFEALVSDGARVEPGTTIARISGPARGILSAERAALNYLMHLSGIATYTARFADVIAHTRAKVTCTRKTIPGLRSVEKYAVRCGGGSSHRYGLDDAILIKDNHIAVAGGIAEALQAAKAFAGHLVKIEIEVDTLDQFAQVLEEGADVCLLDNMRPDMLRQAVAMNQAAVRRSITLEASGNVNLDTIRAIAETGVDFISTSKITMAAPTLDIGLDIAIG